MDIGPIFISHAGQDRSLAKELAEDLQAQGFPVWVDVFEIEPSENWLNDIQEGLDHAGVVVVLWNKAADDSRWVKRELARADADDRHIPTIPLLLDDTPINIVSQITEPIPFRRYFEAFPPLVSQLSRFYEDAERQPTSQASPWRFRLEPTMRSRFLEENHYHPHVSNFGLNDWTQKLVRFQAEKKQAERFVSVVTVPVGSLATGAEFDDLERYLGPLLQTDAGGRAVAPNAPVQRKFPVHMFQKKRTLHRDFIRYDSSEQGNEVASFRRFLRIALNGGVEFADSAVIFVPYNENVWGVHYVMLLGLAWQLAHFAVDLYKDVLHYAGPVQILVNIIGGENSVLDGFSGAIYTSRPTTSQLKCHDKNLQFVYEINSEVAAKEDYVCQHMIEDLGSRLQRSYGMKPSPLQHIPQTNLFDWDLYWSLWS